MNKSILSLITAGAFSIQGMAASTSASAAGAGSSPHETVVASDEEARKAIQKTMIQAIFTEDINEVMECLYRMHNILRDIHSTLDLKKEYTKNMVQHALGRFSELQSLQQTLEKRRKMIFNAEQDAEADWQDFLAFEVEKRGKDARRVLHESEYRVSPKAEHKEEEK